MAERQIPGRKAGTSNWMDTTDDRLERLERVRRVDNDTDTLTKIQDEGYALPYRDTIDFRGLGVKAKDDKNDRKTVVTISTDIAGDIVPLADHLNDGWVDEDIHLPAGIYRQGKRSWLVGSLKYVDAGAITETFTQLDDMAIPTSGDAVPYPSELVVSGVLGSVVEVRVSIDILHNSMSDLDIALVGPTGARSIVITDQDAGDTMNGIYVFDQDAAGTVGAAAGNPKPQGTYRPDHAGSYDGTILGGVPPTADLTVFDGLDPNGTWSLYVYDDSGGSSGTVFKWSMIFDTVAGTDPTQPLIGWPEGYEPAFDQKTVLHVNHATSDGDWAAYDTWSGDVEASGYSFDQHPLIGGDGFPKNGMSFILDGVSFRHV